MLYLIEKYDGERKWCEEKEGMEYVMFELKEFGLEGWKCVKGMRMDSGEILWMEKEREKVEYRMFGRIGEGGKWERGEDW